MGFWGLPGTRSCPGDKEAVADVTWLGEQTRELRPGRQEPSGLVKGEQERGLGSEPEKTSG